MLHKPDHQTLGIIAGVVIGILLSVMFLPDSLQYQHFRTLGIEQMDMRTLMEDMKHSLNGKTGDAFDDAFLAAMIPHHAGAVEMAQQALTSTKNPNILELARSIIASQTAEIKMMESWTKK